MTKLLWAETGEVACEKHAPFNGSDTWNRDRWSEVPQVDETADLECEVCTVAA